MPLILRNTRTTDSLRHGMMGEFLARWCRACAACALMRNSRTTDSVAAGWAKEFVTGWGPRPAFALLMAMVAGALAFGQTPADLYAYEEYQSWAAKQKPGEDLLDRYKAHLVAGGADSVDAESQVRTVLRLAGAESAHPFLVEMVRGRKAGKALEVAKGKGRNGEWLERQGWAVIGIDVAMASKSPFAPGSWDLIVVNAVPLRDQEAAAVGSLRPGGLLILTGLERGAAPRGLRLVKVSETEGLYCGEKAK